MSSKLLVLMILLSLVATQAFALTKVTPTPMPADFSINQHINAVAGTPDYDNTATLTGMYHNAGTGIMLADDVHRTSSNPIGSIEFGYYSVATTAGTVDAYLAIYAGNADDTVCDLLNYYYLEGLPTDPQYYYTQTVDIDPLVAPQDIWVGVAFSDDATGLISSNPPSTGVSHDYFVMDINGDGLLNPDSELAWFGGSPAANFYIKTIPAAVPEPGSLLALGGGLVSLLAFRRRR